MSKESRNITKEGAGKEVVASVKVAKEKAQRKRVTLTPPPAPPLVLEEVPNPIIAKKSLKRALTKAIVLRCTHKDGTVDVDKAAAMIRTSGILYKAGYNGDVKTDPLSQSEWSGKPYVRWATMSTDGKVYDTKHPEKIKECDPFARVLKHAVDEEIKKEKEAKELATSKA